MLIGFDFGGSLIKISILIKPELKEKEEIIKDIKKYITQRFHLKNSKTEYINFIILKTDRQKFFNFLKNNSKFLKQKIIYGTGGGSRSFTKEIEKSLKNKKFEFINEFLAIINGIKKFHLFFKKFVFKLDFKNEKKIYLDIQNEFPFLLTNLGTGISMNFVTEKSSKYCSGSSLGGGTFIGFVRQFFPKIKYEEIVDKIKKYIDENGMEYEFENYLHDSFHEKNDNLNERGNKILKTEKIFENNNEKKVENGKYDINLEGGGNENLKKNNYEKKFVMKLIYGFYLRILNNIALLSFNLSKIKKCDNIVFIGNFLKDHTFSKIIINNIIKKLNLIHKVNKIPIFLEIDGFLGSFTCLDHAIKNYELNNL